MFSFKQIFYYRRSAVPGVCIFVDGPQHSSIAAWAEERRARDALEYRGYRVVAIAADISLARQIDAYPDIFARAANGR